MTAILIENALVLALIVVIGALVFYVIREFSPLGLRLRQTQNRRTLVGEALTTCKIHGPQPPESLVRLDDGTLVCSHCFQEALHANHHQ